MEEKTNEGARYKAQKAIFYDDKSNSVGHFFETNFDLTITFFSNSKMELKLEFDLSQGYLDEDIFDAGVVIFQDVMFNTFMLFAKITSVIEDSETIKILGGETSNFSLVRLI